MNKLIVDSCVFINSFKADSEVHQESSFFLSEMLARKQLITMPAHGLFEVMCSLKRIEKIDKQFVAPEILTTQEYAIETIHIDQHFINKYINVEVPYIKAGDHIFIVVAKSNGFPLITWDKGMYSKANECGVAVHTPTEYLNA